MSSCPVHQKRFHVLSLCHAPSRFLKTSGISQCRNVLAQGTAGRRNRCHLQPRVCNCICSTTFVSSTGRRPAKQAEFSAQHQCILFKYIMNFSGWCSFGSHPRSAHACCKKFVRHMAKQLKESIEHVCTYVTVSASRCPSLWSTAVKDGIIFVALI